MALQRLEVAARWWEALRRLGSQLNTQAMGVMVWVYMAYGHIWVYMWVYIYIYMGLSENVGYIPNEIAI